MIKKLILAFIALVALLFAGVAVWMSVPFSYQKDLTAAALHSDQRISVGLLPWLSFTPTSTEPSEGIIFFADDVYLSPHTLRAARHAAVSVRPGNPFHIASVRVHARLFAIQLQW